MYRILVKDQTDGIKEMTLEDLQKRDYSLVWVDILAPQEYEANILRTYFNFHPLTIEDCLDRINQRPKVDFYQSYMFFIIHSLNENFERNEIDIYVNEKAIVTVHEDHIEEIDKVWGVTDQLDTSIHVLHKIIDAVVDAYLPKAYQIEEQLNVLEDHLQHSLNNDPMSQLYEIRTMISRLRRIILPMNDLMYRIIHSERISALSEHHHYLNDVYDHLLKLKELVDGYKEFSTDLRDSYMAVSSNKMNETMMTLTIITTIFMPLTFIAGLYGMNFSEMPGLSFRNGFWYVLLFMIIITVIMMILFMLKGWLFRRLYRNEK
ncbi:magnesium/cobalt transporter CorA [Pradoshia sp. D12]|uniref:magnesium/cobalt transporter CorA n=1 Tax=Bacillaceae TaxID=186817 RepID=UPI000981D5DB|nr:MULTISPECIES: magnesium/cobalt transporter CorA [Bacillaceae]QFK70816.1 magnesium/cobalt transporter CorA [Pradoshia sp. D12]TPF72607.1 magnesium/cobalt transporter CorA [Bacillus sp. D12]